MVHHFGIVVEKNASFDTWNAENLLGNFKNTLHLLMLYFGGLSFKGHFFCFLICSDVDNLSKVLIEQCMQFLSAFGTAW